MSEYCKDNVLGIKCLEKVLNIETANIGLLKRQVLLFFFFHQRCNMAWRSHGKNNDDLINQLKSKSFERFICKGVSLKNN